MLINSVGIWFPFVLNFCHWPLQRLAKAWLRGSNFVASPSLTVAVSLSCSVALVIVELSVNMTFSRFMLLDSGAPPRLLVG